MPNDSEWNRRTTEWVEMSHRSRKLKEAQGKSLQKTETELTDLERQQQARSMAPAPHQGAKPPRSKP